MRRTILLDGDLYAFKAAAAQERPVQFSESLTVLTGNPSEVFAMFKSQVSRFMDKLKADETIVCFSSPTRRYFRHEVLPTYKQNRTGTRKPLTLGAVVEMIKAEYKTYAKDDLEGDDVMGILSTNKNIVKGRKIIVSGDKDMKSIPGFLYRDGEEIEIDEATADYYHMYQTLVGDSTDGYSGCTGVGPVGAKKVLGSEIGYTALWPKVVEAFAKAKLSEEWATTQARVARILRNEDYDFKNKLPILWRPPVYERTTSEPNLRTSDAPTSGDVASDSAGTAVPSPASAEAGRDETADQSPVRIREHSWSVRTTN